MSASPPNDLTQLTEPQPRVRKREPGPRPDWLRVRYSRNATFDEIKRLKGDLKLHTVCEEARCPNIDECWSAGTATFMLTVPEIEGFPPTIENPYDMISLKDEERILSPANPQILLQFQKASPQEGQIRKLLVGNCKLLDAKNEKKFAIG